MKIKTTNFEFRKRIFVESTAKGQFYCLFGKEANEKVSIEMLKPETNQRSFERVETAQTTTTFLNEWQLARPENRTLSLVMHHKLL